jgi:hypothetical protein
VPVPQVEQAFVHPVLQQIPATQLPLPHSSACEHVLPFDLVPAQMPPAQLLPAHWSSAVHVAPRPSAGTHSPPPSTAVEQ